MKNDKKMKSTGVYFDSRGLFSYLKKYCITNNCFELFEPYDMGSEYGVNVPVSEKVDLICEF